MTTLRVRPGTRCRRRIPRAFLGACVAVLGVAGFATHEAHAAAGPNVAVPAYFWSSLQWDRMLVNSAELRYVVLNPDSGPGAVSYPSFVTKVANARSQGATVVGYVDTSYAARPLSVVKADIDRYRSWYGVNAFFFDQTPYDCAQITYYDDLKAYVRAQSSGLIMHNPGMNPEECFLSAADVIVNFEGSEASYNGWTPAAYAATYPADRFWHIVYSVEPTHGAALRATASGRNAGLVYLTEQNMPNPFPVIPTDALWNEQTPTRLGRPAAPQVPPVSTIASNGRPNAPQSGTPSTTAPGIVPVGALTEATGPSAPSAPLPTTTAVSPAAGNGSDGSATASTTTTSVPSTTARDPSTTVSAPPTTTTAPPTTITTPTTSTAPPTVAPTVTIAPTPFQFQAPQLVPPAPADPPTGSTPAPPVTDGPAPIVEPAPAPTVSAPTVSLTSLAPIPPSTAGATQPAPAFVPAASAAIASKVSTVSTAETPRLPVAAAAQRRPAAPGTRSGPKPKSAQARRGAVRTAKASPTSLVR